MGKILKSVRKLWFLYFVELLLFMQLAVFLACRDKSYIAVHDNLDLFIAHFKVLKLQKAFFAHNVTLPIVGGLDRDVFGSEFLLYNIFYYFFDPYIAYFIGYFAKVFIGLFSFTLLAKDVYGEAYGKYRPIVIVTALAFSLIPVFPTYGIAFTSVPLVVFLLRKIYFEEKVKTRLLWYLLLFLYPCLSYFSYHGFFILCYMVCAVIILWIRDRRFPFSIFISLFVLSLGYVLFEYRLFGAMLFSDTVTIRDSMVMSSLGIKEVCKLAMEGFVNGQFHCQDSHMYLVLPISLFTIIFLNTRYIRMKDLGKMIKDPINLIFLWIVFNSLIYGMYDWEPLRSFVETLVPKLKGFQFDRTLYFNTFLWYVLLFLICKRLYDTGLKAWVVIANVIVALAALVVMFEPQVYNDFYYTCYNQAYKVIKHKDTSTVNYREFYSQDLFEKIKEDIDYKNEWAVAYGMHPAVLEYNGIWTLDGYIGMYTDEYKGKWRDVIAPALDESDEFRRYFDEWGPRAYLFSASGENTYAPLREFKLEDERLMIDADALRALGCRYIFSRIRLSNEKELGIKPKGTYEDAGSPYVIFLYEL